MKKPQLLITEDEIIKKSSFNWTFCVSNLEIKPKNWDNKLLIKEL